MASAHDAGLALRSADADLVEEHLSGVDGGISAAPVDHEMDVGRGWTTVSTHKRGRDGSGSLSDGSLSSSRTVKQFRTSAPVKPSMLKCSRIPPIIVTGQTNWQRFLKDLRADNLNFEAKFVGDNLHLTCSSEASFREVQACLSQRGTNFHTFGLQAQIELKVLIRGLHHSTLPDDIKEELESAGFSPLAATPITSQDGHQEEAERRKRRPCNLFMVKLKKVGSWEAIWKLGSLMGVKVTVEEFRPRNGVPQCYNCQRFGHSSVNCFQEPRCLKCSGTHRSRDCTLPETSQPKCCNCGLNHVASYRGCQAHKDAVQVRKPRNSRGNARSQPVPVARDRSTSQRPPRRQANVTPGRTFATSVSGAANGGQGPPLPPPTATTTSSMPPPPPPAQPAAKNHRRRFRKRRQPVNIETDTDLDTETDTNSALSHVVSAPKPQRTNYRRQARQSQQDQSTETTQPEVTAQQTPTAPETPAHAPAAVSTLDLAKWIGKLMNILLSAEDASPQDLIQMVLQSLLELLQHGQSS